MVTSHRKPTLLLKWFYIQCIVKNGLDRLKHFKGDEIRIDFFLSLIRQIFLCPVSSLVNISVSRPSSVGWLSLIIQKVIKDAVLVSQSFKMEYSVVQMWGTVMNLDACCRLTTRYRLSCMNFSKKQMYWSGRINLKALAEHYEAAG